MLEQQIMIPAKPSSSACALNRERRRSSKLVLTQRIVDVHERQGVAEDALCLRIRCVKPTAEGTFEVLSDLRKAFVDLPVVVYFTTRSSFSEHVSEFGRAGVHDFVLLDVDDEPSLLRTRLLKSER